MISEPRLPRILVIDDLFGRRLASRPNPERASLCAQYLLVDVTGDEAAFGSSLRIKRPIAEAVFCRGQSPINAAVGDVVENDLPGTIELVREGWFGESDVTPWSLVLLDLCFYTGPITTESASRTEGIPEGRADDEDPIHYFGLTLLSELNQRFPDLPVVMLSSQSREEVSREFSSRGALSFLPRTDQGHIDVLRETIGRHGLISDPTGEIVGLSKSLLLVLREARQAAAGRRNILIRGERGVGKELLARYIHRHSTAVGPYVVVDSGTLSPELYASELFGHKRGAFTGAEGSRVGKISLANGGDLFLDEIGNMPPDVQAGLLRVLEQKEVAPVGAERGTRVDVRFISATNEDLERKIAQREFRGDLYDRLCEGSALALPPLRARREDVPALARTILHIADRQTPTSVEHLIEPSAMQCLQEQEWPGNIRELRNCVTSAVTRFANVEHLFPQHFGLAAVSLPVAVKENSALAVTAEMASHFITLADALRCLSTIRPAELDAGTLSQVFQETETVFAQFRITLLKAALEATRRRSPECPRGEVRLHPAVKLLFGRRDISASKAADIIKKLIHSEPRTFASFLQDDVIREVYERALRLRPAKAPQDLDSTKRAEET
jgi:DNA-binding NtrC family response regulator